MRTDALIDMLARGAGPAPRGLPARRLAPACAIGLAASVAMAIALIGWLPAAMFETPAPWIKLAYTASLALAAAWLVGRAARPAAPLGRPGRAVLAVVLVMGGGAAAALFGTAPADRMHALLGETWRVCAFNVLALSLPALGLALWAMKGLAPTRLRLAGFASGLMAGAIGAFGYSLACPEASPAFVAVWYTLGVLLTGLVGGALGSRVLRW